MTRRPAWWLDVLRRLWPLAHWGARATRVPLIGAPLSLLMLPLFGKRDFNITYIPVNAVLPAGESMALPRAVIEGVIRRSAHRVTINRCSCRDSKRCAAYPVEDACLLLGEDTAAIDSRIAKHLSVEEALAHLESRLSLGLVPLFGRVRIDDLFYGVPNRGRMLTVCFCCPCCCVVLNSARYLPPEVASSVVRMKGVTVGVDDARCRRCSACVDACFVKALTLSTDRVVRDEARCIGCGRCAAVCPEGAATIAIADPDAAIEELMVRIAMRVDVG